MDLGGKFELANHIPGDEARYGSLQPSDKAALVRSGLIKHYHLNQFRRLFWLGKPIIEFALKHRETLLKSMCMLQNVEKFKPGPDLKKIKLIDDTSKK